MTRLLAVNLKDALFQSGGTSHPVAQVGGIFDLVSLILPNAYIVAGIMLFIYLVMGGFSIITSGANQDSLQQGQKTVMNAIIGFAIIFASFWIIQIIEAVTGLELLNTPSFF
jgi:hypothetical protein